MSSEKSVKFVTKCHSCIFCQWKNDRQIGCDLEKLKKYIRSEQAAWDDTTNSYIINTICNTCRGEVWANSHLGKNLISIVDKEVEISLDFLLLITNSTKYAILRYLHDTIDKCVNQKQIPPRKIYILLRDSGVKPEEIYPIVQESCGDIKFEIVYFVNMTLDLLDCIDHVVRKSKSRYYAVFNIFHNIPSNLICTLNDLVNNKLEHVIMVTPEYDIDGLIVETTAHKFFEGNKGLSLINKINTAAEDSSKRKYVFTWEELWTY